MLVAEVTFMRPAIVLSVTAISILLGISPGLPAQDWSGFLKEQAKQRANRMAEEAVDRGLDVAEDAVRCVVTDQTCIDNARGSGRDVVLTTTAAPSANPSTSSNRAAVTDRYTGIIAEAPESTVVNGLVVNHRRVAVQKELTARPPTREEIGVQLPKGARLELETTARQIAQYDPHWRIYQYRLEMPKADLVRFFTDQGLAFDQSWNRLFFPKPAGNGEDFIDNLGGDSAEGFRIWRRPRAAADPGTAP